MPNRLAAEKSPYLLQHAQNPVDWYPWGDEAFARARAEDKPIFLSVGYSTCHWCHVMEHESFEQESVADVLNQSFVSIKVDREERPDVDRVYMSFVQATTGAGGWPMSVWLTPQLKPFFGGTYFPPESRYNRPGFVEVLQAIARAWRDERARIELSATELVRRMRESATASPGGTAAPAPDVLARGVASFAQSYDARHGGFGSAPKFPRPSELLFLLREHARTNEPVPRDLALHALRAMALGGMRDHVGGGFHRYSVDEAWRVPHFEKMLYDQAQLVLAYLEAAQATGDRFFAQVADDTLQYVGRELTHPDGGFYSAEDADSLPPGAPPHGHKVEGAFYTWSASELRQVVGSDADVVAARLGVEEGGNAPFDPQGEFTGMNLLYTAASVDDIVAQTGRTSDDVADTLAHARLALFAARLDRPRPHLDDKVLAAWNGLMIAAFARAARVLRARRFGLRETAAAHLVTAQRAAGFLRDQLWDDDRAVLLRRFRDGDAAVDGYAEDYAALTFGLLELFQADGDPQWLRWADRLQSVLDQRFYDPIDGGWFSTTGEDPTVLIRSKEDYDGAEPSPTALALLNLQVLTHLTPDAERTARITHSIARFGTRLGEYARAVPLVLSALVGEEAGIGQLVIVEADGGAESAAALREVAAEHYRPFLVEVPVSPAHAHALGAALPLVAAMGPGEGQAAAYLCADFTCRAPATTPEALREQLGR
ncbi:MAG: thioredoxin domain-containing protein [Vicinamibacteria bacterium]|nr:thioredoxin domain-containing protein [Vicinamibacteria bacterium]